MEIDRWPAITAGIDRESRSIGSTSAGHRRGALELICQAIREGWLDGNEHSDRRDRLVATLCGLLNIEHKPTREVLSLCQTFFAMVRSNLDSELAALEAERAKCRADI